MPNIQFQFRRGSASEWSSANTVLANGEIGIETTTSQFKIGNGTTGWNSLSYGGLNGAVGYTGSQGSVSTSNVLLGQFRETTVAAGNISGNVSLDVSQGTIFTASVTGNISNLTLANVTNGVSATIILTNTGTFTLTTTSAWKFTGNVRSLTGTANSVDIISVVYAANTYYAALSKGFA